MSARVYFSECVSLSDMDGLQFVQLVREFLNFKSSLRHKKKSCSSTSSSGVMVVTENKLLNSDNKLIAAVIFPKCAGSSASNWMIYNTLTYQRLKECNAKSKQTRESN